MYVTLSMLVTLVYPVLALPVLLSRVIWKSFAPALIGSFPILGNLVVAYLMLADAMRGAAIWNTTITPVAAGISDSQRPLILAAFVTLAVFTMGLLIAMRRSRSTNPSIERITPIGRRSAIVVGLLALILAVSQSVAPSWIASARVLRWEQLMVILNVAALVAGLVFFLALILVGRLVSSSRGVASESPVWFLHVGSLLLGSLLSVGVGMAALLVQTRFDFIAMHGAG